MLGKASDEFDGLEVQFQALEEDQVSAWAISEGHLMGFRDSLERALKDVVADYGAMIPSEKESRAIFLAKVEIFGVVAKHAVEMVMKTAVSMDEFAEKKRPLKTLMERMKKAGEKPAATETHMPSVVFRHLSDGMRSLINYCWRSDVSIEDAINCADFCAIDLQYSAEGARSGASFKGNIRWVLDLYDAVHRAVLHRKAERDRLIAHLRQYKPVSLAYNPKQFLFIGPDSVFSNSKPLSGLIGPLVLTHGERALLSYTESFDYNDVVGLVKYLAERGQIEDGHVVLEEGGDDFNPSWLTERG